MKKKKKLLYLDPRKYMNEIIIMRWYKSKK